VWDSNVQPPGVSFNLACMFNQVARSSKSVACSMKSNDGVLVVVQGGRWVVSPRQTSIYVMCPWDHDI
jgi:hypothetical protein